MLSLSLLCYFLWCAHWARSRLSATELDFVEDRAYRSERSGVREGMSERNAASSNFKTIAMLYLLFILLLGSMIGMIIDRNIVIKFFLCYETFVFTISIIMIICSCEINELILILFLLWNSTFEVVLGLSVLMVFNWFILLCSLFAFGSLRSPRARRSRRARSARKKVRSIIADNSN